MCLLYSHVLHVKLEDANFGNDLPLNYKILDKSPMVNEVLVKQPNMKAIYLNSYILKTNFYYLTEINFPYQFWSNMIWLISPLL